MRGSPSAKTRGACHRARVRATRWRFCPRMTSLCLFLQMLREKRHAARPGDIGAGLVVARPLIAVKAVLCAGIDVDFDVGPLGFDGLDIGERNARVLFAEMQ